MKTPRIDAFVTPDKVHELASPLDGLPAIRPPGGTTPGLPKAALPEPAQTPPTQPKRPDAPTAEPLDLADYPTKNATFPVTDQESLALDELKLTINRTYQPPLTVTKDRLLRLAIHCLVDDFQRNGEKSFAVRKLSKESK